MEEEYRFGDWMDLSYEGEEIKNYLMVTLTFIKI